MALRAMPYNRMWGIVLHLLYVSSAMLVMTCCVYVDLGGLDSKVYNFMHAISVKHIEDCL